MESTAKSIAKSITKSLPLFARAKRRELVTLIVQRFEDGRWVRALELIPAAELPDRESVQARFGGGRYDVIGRDKNKIVARTRFVVDGPALPLGDEAMRSPVKRKDLREFATANGERQAIVFAMFDERVPLTEITRRTGIETQTLRAIYLEWLTPIGRSLPSTQAEIEELEQRRERELHARELTEWEHTWKRSTRP